MVESACATSTMLRVFLTIDTEYSAGLYVRGVALDRRSNYRLSIEGRAEGGSVGVGYQMDVLDAHGLKAVFFVDPLPGLLWGQSAVDAVVRPILARGHDVQLHAHTEWLSFLTHGPFADWRGRNIGDFPLDRQVAILAKARELLMAAGAPAPIAFRAGNYGANDDTLRALAELGIRYDSSACPGLAESDCHIDWPSDHHDPLVRHGITEVPIGSIAAPGEEQRHAQITALSFREMRAAIRHARDEGRAHFTVVSHSFELMSRDRRRVNRVVQTRFERLCRWIAETPGVTTGTYRDDPPVVRRATESTPVPHNPLRTVERLGEQAVSNLLYGGP